MNNWPEPALQIQSFTGARQAYTYIQIIPNRRISAGT